MVNQQQQVDTSILAITAAIGTDIAYLENDEMSHFDPVVVVEGVAAILLSSFFDGVRDAAKDAGKEAGAALVRRLAALFKKEEQPPSRVEVAKAARHVRRADLQRHGEVSHKLLVDALVKSGFPLRKAQSLARTVRAEADRVVS